MVYGIVLAAGRGTRFGSKKQIRILKGKPVFSHSISVFSESGLVDNLLLIVPPQAIELFKEEINEIILKTPHLTVIEGGQERYQSVRNAIRYLANQFDTKENDKVILHDAARPLIKNEYLHLIINKLKDFPAASLGYKITDALKKVNDKGFIKEDIDRENIWAVTTPQGFHLKKLMELIEDNDYAGYDETSLFLEKNLPVKIIDAGRYNLKLTYTGDLEIAEKLMEC